MTMCSRSARQAAGSPLLETLRIWVGTAGEVEHQRGGGVEQFERDDDVPADVRVRLPGNDEVERVVQPRNRRGAFAGASSLEDARHDFGLRHAAAHQRNGRGNRHEPPRIEPARKENRSMQGFLAPFTHDFQSRFRLLVHYPNLHGWRPRHRSRPPDATANLFLMVQKYADTFEGHTFPIISLLSRTFPKADEEEWRSRCLPSMLPGSRGCWIAMPCG